MAQYTNGLQRPVKPNIGGLLLLAGARERSAQGRRCGAAGCFVGFGEFF